MEEIRTDLAPEALGPYSQAVSDGNTVYVSGQLPIDMKTGELVVNIKEGTLAALNNLEKILLSAQSSKDKVMKVTIFLADIKDFDMVNDAYKDFFQRPYPARSCVQVGALPKGARLEIECIAKVS